MNKLLVEEDIKNIFDGDYELEFYKDLELNINGSVKLSSISTNDLKININDNSVVNLETIYLLDKDLNININIGNDVILEHKILIINKGINKFNITLNMCGNNSDVKIKLRVINKNNESNIDVNCNGIIERGTANNKLLEDLKGLLINDGIIKISPNIKVLTYEVEANHFVTIGSFNKEEIFYLESKGLSQKHAEKILIDAFALSIIGDNNKEKIKTEVRNIE